MIYNCYIKNNQYIVDVAKSDSEIITKKFKFSMKLGLLSKNILLDGCNFIDETYQELYSGRNLFTIEFNNHFKYRNFLKENKDKILFGEIDPVYYCISDHFKEPLKVFNPKFFTLDIEVYCKKGFPDPYKADYVINLITMCDYQNEKYYTWGLKPFHNETKYDVQYFHCENEVDLIDSMIEFIESEEIKCISGWNTDGFDVPYIINRMIKLRAKSFIIDDFIKNNISTYGRDKKFTTIQVIDYMELYKKFKGIKLERYALDFVSVFEGFEGKNKLSGSFTDVADNNWNEYVEYNIIDNLVIIQLEKKLKYVKLAFSMANDNKCLPTDIFSPVKLWDCATYFELYNNHNCLVPPKIPDVSMKLLGGFVGQPNTNGFQKYISVFDIASSYPHQIIEFNVSPETIISDKKLHDDLRAIRAYYTPSITQMIECPDIQFKKDIAGFVKELRKRGIPFTDESEKNGDITTAELNLYRVKYNVWRFSEMDLDTFPFTDVLVKHNVTMTCNLQFYKKAKVGIIPYLIDKYFKIRNEAKQNEKLLKLNIGLLKEENKEVFELDDIEMIDENDCVEEFGDEEDEVFELV